MVNTMKLQEGWIHVFFVPLAAEDFKCVVPEYSKWEYTR